MYLYRFGTPPTRSTEYKNYPSGSRHDGSHLCFGKRATVECIQLFHGPVCIDNSKLMTLLVVIYQRLILALKKGVQFVFEEQQKRLSEVEEDGQCSGRNYHFAKS